MATYQRTEVDFLLENLIEPQFEDFDGQRSDIYRRSPALFKHYAKAFWLLHSNKPNPDGFALSPVSPSGALGQGALL